MNELTDSEQIIMINGIFDDPLGFDPKWIQLLTQYKRLLMVRKMGGK